jgi:hypothetical protein
MLNGEDVRNVVQKREYKHKRAIMETVDIILDSEKFKSGKKRIMFAFWKKIDF